MRQAAEHRVSSGSEQNGKFLPPNSWEDLISGFTGKPQTNAFTIHAGNEVI